MPERIFYIIPRSRIRFNVTPAQFIFFKMVGRYKVSVIYNFFGLFLLIFFIIKLE